MSADEKVVKVEVVFTKRSYELLQKLAETGLYGLTPANVAERLAMEGLLRRIDERDLKLRLPGAKP